MSTPMYDTPDHFMIPVNWHGDGPVKESEADHWACWCGDNNCPGYVVPLITYER